MKTGGEYVRVGSGAVSEDGSKLEPEEQPATEGFVTEVEVNVADHAVKPGSEPDANVGSMPGSFGVDTTAGDVAKDVATRCELCEHWRNDDWREHIAAIEDTPDGKIQLDRLRAELIGQTKTVDDQTFIAVNITIMRQFGICAAFTEEKNDVTATPYYGGCPEGANYFKLRDPTAQRIASAGYDKILRLAQGRKE